MLFFEKSTMIFLCVSWASHRFFRPYKGVLHSSRSFTLMCPDRKLTLGSRSRYSSYRFIILFRHSCASNAFSEACAVGTDVFISIICFAWREHCTIIMYQFLVWVAVFISYPSELEAHPHLSFWKKIYQTIPSQHNRFLTNLTFTSSSLLNSKYFNL